MKRLFIFVVCAGFYAAAFGQVSTEDHPQRTPEEIALKQNLMLIRELGLSDSAQLDTLFRMHLKYARLRAISNTRGENLERLQAMTEELRSILSPEQFKLFINREVQPRPRPQHILASPSSDSSRTQPMP